MIWGAIASDWHSPSVFIEGKLDSTKFIDILTPQLQQMKEHYEERGWFFLQDNAPMHTSKLTRNLLLTQNIAQLKFPARSPDLNPIENYWGLLSRTIYAGNRQYANVHQLRSAISEHWHTVCNKHIDALITSMTTRMRKVVDENGDSIDY